MFLRIFSPGKSKSPTLHKKGGRTHSFPRRRNGSDSPFWERVWAGLGRCGGGFGDCAWRTRSSSGRKRISMRIRKWAKSRTLRISQNICFTMSWAEKGCQHGSKLAPKAEFKSIQNRSKNCNCFWCLLESICFRFLEALGAKHWATLIRTYI